MKGRRVQQTSRRLDSIVDKFLDREKKRRRVYRAFAEEMLLAVRRGPKRFDERAGNILVKYRNRGLSLELLWLVGRAVVEGFAGAREKGK